MLFYLCIKKARRKGVDDLYDKGMSVIVFDYKKEAQETEIFFREDS
jgi:hypothetical protein